METYIFISHSSEDSVVAQKLCEYLEIRNKRCFIAPRNIRSGHEYAQELLNGIDNSYVVVLMLSNNSNESPHVLREIERAVSKNIPIVVYKMENVVLSKSLEYFLMTHQWMNAKDETDFSKIYESVCSLAENNQELNEVPANDEISEKRKTEYSPDVKINNIRSNKIKYIICGAAIVSVLMAVFVTCKYVNNSSENNDDNSNINQNNAISYQDDIKDSDVIKNENIQKKQDDSNKEDNEKDKSAPLKIADTIKFGTYNNTDLEWTVFDINEDGTAQIVTNQIITFKAFDSAESGESYMYNGQFYPPGNPDNVNNFELLVQTIGNNDWSTSNIRTWLNSDSQYVKYDDAPPISKGMADYKNGYDTEPGFLYNFTAEEKSAIVITDNTTKEYYRNNGSDIVTQDKVYLLTKADVEKMKNAGINIYASPTKQAVEDNESVLYSEFKNTYNRDEFYWWLREPVENTPDECYFVTSGCEDNKYSKRGVNVESFGIRPAITVDVSKLIDGGGR